MIGLRVSKLILLLYILSFKTVRIKACGCDGHSYEKKVSSLSIADVEKKENAIEMITVMVKANGEQIGDASWEIQDFVLKLSSNSTIADVEKAIQELCRRRQCTVLTNGDARPLKISNGFNSIKSEKKLLELNIQYSKELGKYIHLTVS